MKNLKSQYLSVFFALKDFIFSPHFIVLSTLGNGLVFVFAEIFYHIEFGVNMDVDERMDSIWWAFATVTSVGYGDIVPVTFWGRIVGIVLMVIGTVLFASYIALFADTFLGIELSQDRLNPTDNFDDIDDPDPLGEKTSPLINK